jgi:nucleotide-binding universal stress UspA family protein
MQRELVLKRTPWREVTLDVGETIKGEPMEQVVFLMEASEPLAKVERSWADVLVFLNRVEGGVEANKSSDRLGGWRAERGLVFVLDQKAPAIYRMDGTVVADGEGLLKTVREAGAFGRSPKARLEHVEVYPDASPWWLGPRSLIVPKDERIERIAKEWMESGDAALRTRGIDVIAKFPSSENVTRVRRLLVDPFYGVREAAEWSPKVDERAWKDYPLRRRAVGILTSWHEQPGGQADASTPLLRYVPAHWRRWAVGLGLIVAVAFLWPGRWGSPGLGGRGAIVGLGLVGIVAMIWWRSVRADEAYSFAGGSGADYEVVSAWGRLAVLRVQDQAPPHGWMVRRFTWEESSGGLWFRALLLPGEEAGWVGIYAGEGRTAGAGGYSYRLIALPYWAVMAVVGAWPAAWGVSRIRRARRRRRWLKANRCGRCGYDLRGHTGEGRCPECGEENAPRRGRRWAGGGGV